MGSLFAALGTASGSLGVLEQAIGVVQNNVTNATTPGYVTQTLQMAARPFNATSLLGGVESTGMQSARDVYAEQSVWSASQQSGLSSQQSASLNQLQQVFDVTGQSGIPGALSTLYSAFSAWSASPSDPTAQQSVLTAAQGLSTAFTQTFSQAQQISSDSDQQLSASVNQLNQYTSQIAAINGQIRTGSGNDAGLQAQLYNTLEKVSNLAPVTVNFQSDGTATVLLAGQSPLVQGTTQYDVQPPVINTAVSPNAQLLSADGHDITSLFDQGTIGGALNFSNTTMPGIVGGLNALAQNIATSVNTPLTTGQTSTGTAGADLFKYTALAGSAGSLTVTNLNASQLAAAFPAPPAPVTAANGVASQLAALVNSTVLNGFTLTELYGNVASSVGQQTSTASSNATSDTSLLTQAQSLRAQVSGVSLNDQATQLLEFQQSYQAAAQIISTIHTILQSLMTTLQVQ
jgi:flagellar hook-associated protein 1 FlgK